MLDVTVIDQFSEREWHFAILLQQARTALWAEWSRTGSDAAFAAFDATDPKDVV